MIKKTAIFKIERAIVPFVRLGVILLLALTLIGCSGTKYKTATIKANNLLTIQSIMEFMAGTQQNVKTELVEEYVSSENGSTYYYFYYKVDYTEMLQDKTLFITIKCNIKNDLSVEYASHKISQGSD